MITIVLVLSTLTNSAGLFATSHAQPLDEPKIKVETVATRLQIPWAIAFFPEFGHIVSLTLVASIALMLVLSAKNRLR